MAINKFLEELSVEDLLNKYNFIIPEIQREYVWGSNEQNILDKFFLDIKEGINETSLSEEDTVQIEAFQKMLQKVDSKDKENVRKLMDTYLAKKDMNIGFLYSYKPGYYIYNDLDEDVYLIDGQQRLTTLFLSLFYFALKEKENYEDFLNLFRFDQSLERIAFDYRVRTLTHNFLIELLARCQSIEDLVNIKEKTWFLTDFALDVTVNSMVNTLRKLHEFFGKDDKKYYQFIKKQIRFWHFKTEETSQGEELYITMNSRGQQLADNETLRASLFENEKVKKQQIAWGAKWERWQDFFWQNKQAGGNADLGLNQFLKWVNIIECFTTKQFKTKDEGEKMYKSLISENRLLDYVTLFEIEPYFESLYKLAELHKQGYFNDSYFKANFSSDWLKAEMSQLNLMKLLPAILYLKYNQDADQHLNRFIRFFANLTNEVDIAKNPDTYIIDAIAITNLFVKKGYSDVASITEFKDQFPKFLTSEEVFKLNQFSNETDEVKRTETEIAFWNAEDFQIPKGRIGHLIQMTVFQGQPGQFIFNRQYNYQNINDFNLTIFKEIFALYKEANNNIGIVWGNLINSDLYIQAGDRVYYQGSWKTNNSLLRLILERYTRKSESLTEYLISKERDFIKLYTEDGMRAESDPKKQLYLYYILHKRVLNKWEWKKWNFGMYDEDDYPDHDSLFNRGFIYQFYNSQWRYNVGYEAGSGLWVQDNYDPKRKYFTELLTWANLN